jgi:pimeloyl-ACP methyl ester carboxylesterase
MPYQNGIAYFENRTSLDASNPLVLIHGAGGSYLSWPPEIRRLPSSKIYALELPGHGQSPGEGLESIEVMSSAVAGWLEALHLRQVILTGHSMGAAIALQLALERPEWICGLVLLGAGASLPVNPRLLEAAGQPESFPKAVELIVRWSFSSQSPEKLKTQVATRLTQTRPLTLQRDLQACMDFNISQRLAEIDAPTLVICGSEDKMTPPEQARFLVEHIPGARLALVQGAGHMLMLEQPETITRLIQAFVTGL